MCDSAAGSTNARARRIEPMPWNPLLASVHDRRFEILTQRLCSAASRITTDSVRLIRRQTSARARSIRMAGPVRVPRRLSQGHADERTCRLGLRRALRLARSHRLECTEGRRRPGARQRSAPRMRRPRGGADAPLEGGGSDRRRGRSRCTLRRLGASSSLPATAIVSGRVLGRPRGERTGFQCRGNGRWSHTRSFQRDLSLWQSCLLSALSREK